MNKNNPEIGPRVLILAPTRELVIQIFNESLKYASTWNIKCSYCLGGIPSNQQKIDLKNGVDLLVATPGRLIDLINWRCTSLIEVT